MVQTLYFLLLPRLVVAQVVVYKELVLRVVRAVVADIWFVVVLEPQVKETVVDIRCKPLAGVVAVLAGAGAYRCLKRPPQGI